MNNSIKIYGANENNLKNIDVEIPRNKLVVLTGLSGSGKSSLAFDTLFAECQRKFMESLSSYARQFLGSMQKPDVREIIGTSPAIAIDQKTTSSNPRSTVGTITEIYDYLRLLYASIGKPYCVNCGTEITTVSVDSIVEKESKNAIGKKIIIMAPVVRNRKGEYSKQLEGYRKAGYVRVRIDGENHTLDEEFNLDKQKKHTIEIIIDRLVGKEDMASRFAGSVETAVGLADGLVIISVDGKETLYSTKHACPECGFSFPEISPRIFSFNTPFGACEECTGIGSKLEVVPELIIPNPELSINQGGLKVYGFGDGTFAKMYFNALSKKYKFSLDTPIKDLPHEIMDILLYGNHGEELDLSYATKNYVGQYKGHFEGIINTIKRRYKESTSDWAKAEMEKLMITKPCKACHGTRLNKTALAVKVGGINIAELCDMSVIKIDKFFDELKLTKKEEQISNVLIHEIRERIKFLIDVGLGYLTLSRSSGTLSGGEAQRIRLASQIGSGLVGVLYVLDEPSIGLHPRDTAKLIKSLKKLRDLGNTVVVVEHDEETIRQADYIIDIGPKAGVHGGKVVAAGTLADIINNPKSITGQYLSGELKIEIPKHRREPNGKYLTIVDAYQNNLKHISVDIPLGVFTAITGISGSGKSSLINDCLYPALANRLNRSRIQEGNYGEIRGIENLDKVVVIDQTPIGRTPRSNPATYTGVFTAIRELFATTPDAKERGYTASRFSFNISGGRCEECGGDGLHKIEMHFLPDVYVTCEACGGKRYNRETLEVKYKGKSINDVLEMTIEDAVTFFENIPSIKNKIQALYDVGLGYIKLGQPATTLSGGEAQRVKLATELSKRATGKTIYILDEPTTGLHTYDVHKLINILQKLVQTGNTVVVIEHNTDVIKVVDYIIDLGPEGGDKGGKIVAKGTPEEVAKVESSATGKVLRQIL